MIYTAEELKDFVAYEKKLYQDTKRVNNIVSFVCKDYTWMIWKYMVALRHSEFHLNNSSVKKRKKNGLTLFHDICFLYWRRKKNRLGRVLGIEIFENCFEKGLKIHHCTGGIVVNGYARIGRDCQLHGNNCIGNIYTNDRVPHIGNNVDIGYGASVIGDITLGNNVAIAAGAIVNKSYPKDGLVLGGIPATILKSK